MHYHVIIVGGRPAGSTLAARLGAAGLSVLLLERGTLPSLPAASSPIIYSPAMALLDEIGADEHSYAHNTPRICQWVVEGLDAFRVHQPIPSAHERDYAYAIDRARFDAALWAVAAAHPTVDARQQTAFIKLLWDGEQVRGAQIKDVQTGTLTDVHADLVVGADGRFSSVARQAGATLYDTHDDTPTTIYYAYWRGVRPLHENGAPAAHIMSTGGDYGLLFMDSADDTTAVVIEGRSDVIAPQRGDAEAFYLDFLQQHPSVWSRLAAAERVTPVHGMKKIGNGYRQAGGDGWALVGDAVHQKDPLDGQGIYDALFTAKGLAAAVVDWKCDGVPWRDALQRYERTVRGETVPMYRSTLGRVQREIYTRRPRWFMRTFARWLYTDQRYRAHWARLFVRQADPDTWFSYHRVMLPVLRGMWRDVRSGFGRG